MIEKIIENFINDAIKNAFDEKFLNNENISQNYENLSKNGENALKNCDKFSTKSENIGVNLEKFSSNVHMSSVENVDFQCDDCFSLAKILHKAPSVIAETIVNALNQNENAKKCFENISFKNGFVNFVLSDDFVLKCLMNVNSSEKLGVENPENPELFVLDYGGPNIAKPLHVGHLRSPIIGESVKRIINFAGHKTLSDVHFGDYGLQIGEVIYGLKERNIDLNNITLELLNEIYPSVNARIKTDENLNKICAIITKELQEGNKEYFEYFEKIREISAKDILRIYDYLDVHFDFYKGESDAYKFIPKLTKILNEKNLLQNSEGAKIIDISMETDKKELPPLIYQKSNGAYLYGTTDMATVLDRKENLVPDHILYFADIRQQLHFTQFFRACEKAEIVPKNCLEFYGFGTVNGLDGKPYKTREGKSPSLDSLFNEVKNLLLSSKEMNLKNENDIDVIVNSVIKFADLQNNYEKDYIFDLEKFSKLEGKTGPYILYSYCRFNKILNRFSAEKREFLAENKNDFERNVKLKILSFAPIFNRAFIERKPSIIADYVFDLCLKLNNFYENNRLNDEENKKFISSWLKLIELSLKVVKTCLNLLVINTIEQM